MLTIIYQSVWDWYTAHSLTSGFGVKVSRNYDFFSVTITITYNFYQIYFLCMTISSTIITEDYYDNFLLLTSRRFARMDVKKPDARSERALQALQNLHGSFEF